MENLIKKIETQQAPQAIGPYSQALSVNITNSELLFVSGQLPLDPITGTLVEGGVEEATRRVLDNIEAILIAANSSLSDVVRVEIFLKDINDFQKVNEEYKRRFTNTNFPARQTIQVAKLPLDASIEISCIAVVRK
ncbi:MAG: RidA family protein [Parachlamydiaceae bacterium]|nr:RidA family protein [Parachlamydiaceae bacterium]